MPVLVESVKSLIWSNRNERITMNRFILSVPLVLLVGLTGCEFPKIGDQGKAALTLESAYRETTSTLRASLAVADPNQAKKLNRILDGLEKLRAAYLVAKDSLIARKALRVQHAVPLVVASLQDDKKSAFIRAFKYLSAELGVEISAIEDDADKKALVALQAALNELSKFLE